MAAEGIAGNDRPNNSNPAQHKGVKTCQAVPSGLQEWPHLAVNSWNSCWEEVVDDASCQDFAVLDSGGWRENAFNVSCISCATHWWPWFVMMTHDIVTSDIYEQTS